MSVARAIALAGLATSRVAGCPFPQVECFCRADGAVDRPTATPYGYYSVVTGPCGAQDVDAGCMSGSAPGGPLMPPDLECGFVGT